MKTRWMAWMASGLIASVPLFSSVAQADSNSLTQLFPALVGVQLTPEQQDQLESLSQQTLPQVQTLLTPEQQAQFNDTLAQGNGVRVAALSLNLSVMQRLQIFNILQTARSQLATILSPEQQRQIQRNIQTLQQQGH
jgi:Spy/CpxP family protein refolding chaperone